MSEGIGMAKRACLAMVWVFFLAVLLSAMVVFAKADGLNLQGKAVRNLSGGYIVELQWDAAGLPDVESTYPRVLCFGAERMPGDIDSDRFAARVAQTGWEGLIALEVNWWEPPKAIKARTPELKAAIDRLKRKGVSENFLGCLLTSFNGRDNRPPANPAFGPKTPQWHEEEMWKSLVQYFRALGKCAKETGAKGVQLDIEEYQQSLFHRHHHETGEEYYTDVPDIVGLVRKRGQQAAKAMLEAYPDMDLIILPLHYLWMEKFPHPTDNMPELAVPFCEGILTTFAETQKNLPNGGVYFGSEWTYAWGGGSNYFGYDMSPEGCRKTTDKEYQGMREMMGGLARKYPQYTDYFNKRVSLAAGVWPLGDYLGDEGGPNDIRHSPEQFQNMINAVVERCPRYIWIYTQSRLWYFQNWDDYYNTLHKVHKRPEYFVYRLDSNSDKRRMITRTGGLSHTFSVPDSEIGQYQLKATFEGREVPGAVGKLRPAMKKSAVGDDFSAEQLHQDWEVRQINQGSDAESGISVSVARPWDPSLVKTSQGRLRFSGTASADEVGVAARLKSRKWKDGSVVSFDLGGYQSDGDPIGGKAMITLFADDEHWFRVERSYDKVSPRWIPEEKRYNNGLFYSLKDGPRAEASEFVFAQLASGNVTPVRLEYQNGQVEMSVGGRRWKRWPVNLPGGYCLELGATAPKGVHVEAWFDNLIVEQE